MTLLRDVLVIGIVALFASAATAHAQGKPVTLDLGLVKATVTVPAGWQANEGTPPSFFDPASKGSIQFLATPMEMPDATFGAMHKAALDTGKAKVKSGEYVKAEEHAVDGFKGVLIVESAKDPSIRRLQWQAYGRGGYFNFTMASPTEAFETYLPQFNAALGSIKLAK